jgi:hypothetical protein
MSQSNPGGQNGIAVAQRAAVVLLHPGSRSCVMTAQTMLAPNAPVKTETKQPALAPVQPQKTALASPPRAYWGDRWTLVFWLCCFAIMAGMNLVEGIRSLVHYLFGSAPPP